MPYAVARVGSAAAQYPVGGFMATLASIVNKYTPRTKAYRLAARWLGKSGLNTRVKYRPDACEVCGGGISWLPVGVPTVEHIVDLGSNELLVARVYVTQLGGGWHHDVLTLQVNTPAGAGKITAFSRGEGWTKCTCAW